MIEYYTFKHNGDSETYDDEILMTIIPAMTMVLYYGSNLTQQVKEVTEKIAKVFDAVSNQADFGVISEAFENNVPSVADYMVIRLSNDKVESYKHGEVFAKIVMKGELRNLPNGMFGLSVGDRIVFGTGNFYAKLTDEAVLSDALVSENCSEWMNLMVRRISDANELRCGNLTAINIIVKE